MWDAALEVESNIMAAEKLKVNISRRRQRGESSSSSDPKIDKMTKMIESLASEISKVKVEQQLGKGRLLIPLLLEIQIQIHIEEQMGTCKFCKETRMQMKTKG